jgi:hypothetical protein
MVDREARVDGKGWTPASDGIYEATVWFGVRIGGGAAVQPHGAPSDGNCTQRHSVAANRTA